MEITNGASFLAKVYVEAFSSSVMEKGYIPIMIWSELSSSERKAFAEAFQKMINLGIIEPINYEGFKKLREAGWECARSTKEKEERY